MRRILMRLSVAVGAAGACLALAAGPASASAVDIDASAGPDHAGVCVDLLDGLVHIGLGYPVPGTCG